MAQDIEGADRLQLMLLPVAVDDYIAPASSARDIDTFVDSLDALVGLAWLGHFRGAAGFWSGFKYTGVLKSGSPVHSKVKNLKFREFRIKIGPDSSCLGRSILSFPTAMLKFVFG